jgi:hypothetical protein
MMQLVQFPKALVLLQCLGKGTQVLPILVKNGRQFTLTGMQLKVEGSKV